MAERAERRSRGIVGRAVRCYLMTAGAAATLYWLARGVVALMVALGA